MPDVFTPAKRREVMSRIRLWECALARKRQAHTMARLRRALGSVERGL